MPIDEVLYPVNLVLRGRRCLVVGGGGVASRKVAGLVDAGARVDVVATWVGAEIRRLADELPELVSFVERPYRPSDIEGAWLVITATDAAEVNATVRADGEAAHIWVNAADDPPSCSFILPAVVRQGPVMVTVSTSGQSPAMATWLKAHVGEKMGPEFAVLAGLVGEARAELQAAGRSTEDVDWRPVFNWDIVKEIRAGDLSGARKRLQECLSSSSD